MQTISSISVIICTHTEDRWNYLIDAVESVRRQTLSPDEIIVVVDHNPNLLKRVQKHVQGVIVIENCKARGLSGSRNSGTAVARGVVLAFLDDDAIAQLDWLANLAVCYTTPNVAGVGGKIDPLWRGNHPSWFPDEFNWVIGCSYLGMPTMITPVRNMIGANMSMRKHILTTVGGFRESFGCNKDVNVVNTRLKWFRHHAGDEETELCIRVVQQLPGSVWLYTASALVRHQVPAQRARWGYFLWRCYDEGLGKAHLISMHGIQKGLSVERTYTLKTLPRGIMRGVTETLLSRNMAGLARAGCILTGLVMTTFGFLIGNTLLRATRLGDIIAQDGFLRRNSTLSRPDNLQR